MDTDPDFFYKRRMFDNLTSEWMGAQYKEKPHGFRLLMTFVVDEISSLKSRTEIIRLGIGRLYNKLPTTEIIDLIQ